MFTHHSDAIVTTSRSAVPTSLTLSHKAENKALEEYWVKTVILHFFGIPVMNWWSSCVTWETEQDNIKWKDSSDHRKCVMAKKGLFFKSSFHIHFTFLLNIHFFHRANDVHQFSIVYNFVKNNNNNNNNLVWSWRL